MKASGAFIFFMLFLAGVAFVNLKGMKDNGDAVILTPDELTDVAWRATNIGEMRLAEDTRMHVRFAPDGGIDGDAGCNRFFGHYELRDGRLAVGPLGATRKACPEPAMSFEISFLEALQSASTVARRDNRLVIRNAQGIAVARFVSAEREAGRQ